MTPRFLFDAPGFLRAAEAYRGRVASRRPGAAGDGMKRALDLALAIPALIAVAPLLFAAAVLLTLGEGGPAFIAQERVGRAGRTFRLYKLRTMEGCGIERITLIGWFLRRFSIDELPQLWNVIRGDMSLVGPRPELTEKTRGYAPWQRSRHLVRPGLTGVWQVLGRKDLPLADNIHLDICYIEHRSLPLDIAVLARTVPAVLSGRGAR